MFYCLDVFFNIGKMCIVVKVVQYWNKIRKIQLVWCIGVVVCYVLECCDSVLLYGGVLYNDSCVNVFFCLMDQCVGEMGIFVVIS